MRRAALEAVTAAIGGAPAAAPSAPVLVPATRGRGRPRKAAAPTLAGPPKAPAAPAKPARAAPAPKAASVPKAAGAKKATGAKKAAAPKRARGEKRPPTELAKLVERLSDYVKAHPGQRMETISKALGAATRDLNLPVKKLLAAKTIRTVGEKRATEYFPA